MKRSEVNASLTWAKDLLKKYQYRLPDMAYWTLDEWKARKGELATVRNVMLGWDITDFGTGNFAEIGAVLYTVRNGNVKDASVGVPYCEKYILMKEGQRLPEHYHIFKTEDIINRGGGTLELHLWQVDPATGKRTDQDVHIFMDGIEHVVKPGETLLVQPGNSVSLTPFISHIFGPQKGTEALIVGEVSKVNDDKTDNYFLEPVYRFSEIEEDEPIEHPLCNEYDSVLGE